MRVLTNAFLQRRRRLLSRGEPVPIDDIPDLYLYTKTKEAGLQSHTEDPAKAFLDKLGAEQAAAALQKLPDEFRLACTLYFVEECSYQEIAEALDCPVGTVRSRLHRGRRLLQKMLWEIAEERGLVKASSQQGGSGR
jgi:RNA polymerase sigma-70 factor (ECF subfamily)